jgi:beta-N-acetylhexosaminidase
VISRRALLKAAVLAAVSSILAACARVMSPSPSPGPPQSSAASLPPLPSGSGAPAPSASAASGVTLRQKIARMLVVGFNGLSVDEEPWVRTAIAEQGLGGVVLFDRHQLTGGRRNIESPPQVQRLVADLKGLAPDRALIVAIDQEGGVVTRLSPRFGFPEVTSQAQIAARGLEGVELWAENLAQTLLDVGVTLNLAPVLDLNVNPDNPAIGALNRSFSPNARIVSNAASVEINAHRLRGIRTAVKHFPGLGSATANTDFGVADVTATWTDRELDPYRDLLEQGGLDLVMVGNLLNGQIDDSAPSSLSHATVTGLLREQIGFDGPVITDDLQAVAITSAFGAEEAIRLAIGAGCDVLLFANQQVYDPEIVGRVVDVVEGLVRDWRLTEARIDESLARVEALFVVPGT